jgi:hypothetical protein
MFGEDNRVSVYYDECQYTADELLGDGFGMFALRLDRGYRRQDFGEFTDELNLLCNRIDYSQYESAIGKYLHLAGQHYRVIQLQGYSQSDWANVIVYSPDDFVETPEFRTALRDWWRGDVYYLVHERRELFTNTDGTKTIEQWETVDSISGIMVSDIRELTQICRDTFTLPEEAN